MEEAILWEKRVGKKTKLGGENTIFYYPKNQRMSPENQWLEDLLK